MAHASHGRRRHRIDMNGCDWCNSVIRRKPITISTGNSCGCWLVCSHGCEDKLRTVLKGATR